MARTHRNEERVGRGDVEDVEDEASQRQRGADQVEGQEPAPAVDDPKREEGGEDLRSQKSALYDGRDAAHKKR